MSVDSILEHAAFVEQDTAGRRNHELTRPSCCWPAAGSFRSLDGTKWCVRFGENLQDGVAGFGDSPDEASRDFDREWVKKLAK